MQIIKIGGSLLTSPQLTACLKEISQQQNKTIIVPGGGGFADQVRKAQQYWQFNDKIAHEMALLAMQQTALVFHGLQSKLPIVSSGSEINKALQQNNVVIWSVNMNWLNQSNLKASWDISSDSIAAWLAKQLGAQRLVLIKSAIIPQAFTLKSLADAGIIDNGFIETTQNACYQIEFKSIKKLTRHDDYLPCASFQSNL